MTAEEPGGSTQPPPVPPPHPACAAVSSPGTVETPADPVIEPKRQTEKQLLEHKHPIRENLVSLTPVTLAGALYAFFMHSECHFS